MKCDFCKRRLRKKIVHSATGVYHPVCLDKLHAATEGFGQLFAALIRWNQKGRPENMASITNVVQEVAKPVGEYLTQVARNERERRRSGR